MRLKNAFIKIENKIIHEKKHADFEHLDLTTLIQYYLWPNLKNLSGGLNLSRGLKMVGSN